jgi:DNA-damage-inducible protein J
MQLMAATRKLNYNVIHQIWRFIVMAANQLVQARIDGAIKEEAATVLAAMGLTVSDAVRLMLTRVAREHALPFDPLIPNDVTIAAMKEARAGNLPSAKSITELMAALNADD